MCIHVYLFLFSPLCLFYFHRYISFLFATIYFFFTTIFISFFYHSLFIFSPLCLFIYCNFVFYRPPSPEWDQQVESFLNRTLYKK
jgi:hypothetical protein